MGEMKRREFLVGAATVAVAAALAEKDEKLTDGGYAKVEPPGVPARKSPVVPPGAGGYASYGRQCIGCQLCVTHCPNQVLRPLKTRHPGAPLGLMQPVMGFERGYCRPECTRCGEVCPAGAIAQVAQEKKRRIKIGHAVWNKELCLAATEGVSCHACEWHCLGNAITLVPLDASDKGSPKVPKVDEAKCIGCGACEHLCPARPLPAMTVEGLERHREVVPESDVLAEAAALIRDGRAGAVLVKDCAIAAVEPNGPGVKPLLNLHDNRPDVLKGALVVDKVVGRAAAAIAVDGGAVRVHGLLMSESAKEFLDKQGIPASADEMVPQILHRTRDGLCPLEDSVKKTDIPEKMVKAIRARIKKMMSQ